MYLSFLWLCYVLCYALLCLTRLLPTGGFVFLNVFQFFMKNMFAGYMFESALSAI